MPQARRTLCVGVIMNDASFPHGARLLAAATVFWRAATAAFVFVLSTQASLRAGPPPLLAETLAADSKGSGRCNEPIKPIPNDAHFDAREVALGQTLFHDTRLSGDNSISCATCHDLKRGGADGLPHSQGFNGVEGPINAPSVFNCSLNFRQFWDGRTSTLEDQVDGPLQAPAEMNSSWPAVIAKLKADSTYVERFRASYSDGIQVHNIKHAIATFERSLLTPNSPFDKYLRGNDAALTPDEKEGYRKFKAYGCASCHQGMNVGGNMFETLGAMADYFGARGHVTKADLGRFNVTGREEDRYVFKVPSLRNVALTAPYFHDGSMARLEDAVTAMGKYQLGEALPETDVNQIVQFLKTLTGEYGGKPL